MLRIQQGAHQTVPNRFYPTMRRYGSKSIESDSRYRPPWRGFMNCKTDSERPKSRAIWGKGFPTQTSPLLNAEVFVPGFTLAFTIFPGVIDLSPPDFFVRPPQTGLRGGTYKLVHGPSCLWRRSCDLFVRVLKNWIKKPIQPNHSSILIVILRFFSPKSASIDSTFPIVPFDLTISQSAGAPANYVKEDRPLVECRLFSQQAAW